jgi:MFS family permease
MVKSSPKTKTSYLKSIPRTVFQLGLVSLFNDMAKEMIYPVVPLFLAQVLGAGPAAVGWVEGVAESTSSLLKVFSGIGADRVKKKKPFLIFGFAMSTLLRPLVGLAITWPWVLFLRFADRMGKGVRSAPQDALIADVTNESNRGASYGFHSAMDDAGQLIGPFIAGGLLLLGLSFRNVILLSIIPGIMAWLTVWGIHEKHPVPIKAKRLTLFQDWKTLNTSFKKLLIVLFIFSLGNSADAFLMIRLSQVGVSNWLIALLWGLHGGVRMITSPYGGSLSDRLGRKPLIISGWFYYALIYLGFALLSDKTSMIALFLAYGVFYGLCEPSEKAFVADLAPKELRGTAFGYYNLIIGLGALPASLIFGLIGQQWGYPAAFGVGAALAGLAAVGLLGIRKQR